MIPLVSGGAQAQVRIRAGVQARPGPGVRLSFPRDTLLHRTYSDFKPGGRYGPRISPDLFAALWFREFQRSLMEARRRRREQRFTAWLARRLAAARDIPPEREAKPVEPPAGAGPRVPQLFSELADLGLQLNARFELKMDRLRNEQCTTADLLNPVSACSGGFPTPELDQQFQILSTGVVADRVHVNIDFDSEREFSANNDLRVWYEGLEDEILQRVELGNVTFQAPASRFITSAIPANSFGVQTQAQLGAFDFRTIFAQQKGSSIRSRTYSVGETSTQPVDREIRDLDFEAGRFFTVVDPRKLPGFPAVDVLNLDRDALSPDLRLTDVRVYRLRAQGGQVGSNANLGGINAIAIRDDSPQRVGPFPWELLVEGKDYYIDPSGLWFALASGVGLDDFLAVSYITAAGDTVGTFPAVDRGQDTLFLVYEPRRGFEVPTSEHELRNIYRIGGGISRSTIELTLLVNESERPLSGNGTYLSLLGLARQTDESSLDDFNRVFPRSRDPNNGAPISDLYVVFPNLRPFADSTKLAPAERNDSLYRTPTYLRGQQGPPPRFRLRMHYETTGAGDRSQLNLGALQVREGSEKLFVGNRELVRGSDYEISYADGQVTFLHPEDLFSGPSQVTVQFEENQFFDEAPKSIFGMSTTYNLGSRGRIDFTGLFQKEQSVFTRPQLGFEPQATFIGGISTQLNFRPQGLTTLLNGIPLIETDVPSTLTFAGEVAVSKPNPNQAGQAFIEEFEGAGGGSRTILLAERSFHIGSRPQSGRGLPLTHLGPGGGFNLSDAVPLVWQNLVQSGNSVIRFDPEQIDSTISLVGATRQTETVLWLTLKPDTIGGAPDSATGDPRWFRSHTPGPRWRSITQSLDGSGLGVDLSRVEFLEFWVLEDAERVAMQQQAEVVFDFGTVFEDAVAMAPVSFTVNGTDTVFTGTQFIGQGRLDTEKDTLTNVFNAVTDDVGILGDLVPSIINATTGAAVSDLPLCSAPLFGGLPVFPLGDLGSRCSRGNGLPDTEDLDGDNRLDITVGRIREDVFRYVFPIGSEQFFVRNGRSLVDANGGVLTWRLYRIPFRADTVQIGSPNIRQVRALRMTVVAPDQGPVEREFFIALARMRLVGAPWLKRSETPIKGINGVVGQPHGEVVASVATTENQDLNYESPPGVVSQADRRGATFQLGRQQVNERSLRLLARDLRVGERAEAFVRFTDEADKNFLKYRKLRVWARGRGPGWEDGDLEFFIKVGRDENNFYMYKTKARSASWEPEVVVDINTWTLLRSQIEDRWLSGEEPSGAEECGGDPNAFVACKGPYIVHVRDPGISPPNLARVSEVAVGMMRTAQNVFISQAEVWVDDIRLSDVVADAGLAGAVDVRLQAADVATFDFGFSGKDDRFRQLDEEPSYVTDRTTRFGTTFRADKFLPESWGLNIPVSILRNSSTSDPFFLNKTDVRADALSNLRKPDNVSTSYQVTFRRSRPGDSFLEHLLLDPVQLRATVLNAHSTSELTESKTKNRQYAFTYNNLPGEKTVKGAPGFLVKLVDALPSFISKSAFADGLRDSRLRWNPAQFRLSSTLSDNVTTRSTFRVPVALASDTAIRPIRSINHTWRNDLSLDLRPFRTFSLRGDYSSTRDLQDYGDSTTVGRLLRQQRKGFLGTDVGFERLRTLTTALSVQPALSRWLEPRLTFSSAFTFNRDPNRARAVRVEGDSLGEFRIPETVSNSRRQEIGATLRVGSFVSSLVGDSNTVTRLLKHLQSADFRYTVDRRSNFDRAVFNPGLSYQLALGGRGDFRVQDGILATSASESRSLRASSGVSLPLGLRFTTTFNKTDGVTWSRRSNEQTQVRQDSRDWPSGVLSWNYQPRWRLREVATLLSAQLRYVKSRQRTFVPVILGLEPLDMEPDSAGQVVTQNSSRTLAPTVSVTWIGGVVTSFQLTRIKSDRITAGNITRTDQKDWSANANFSFKPPKRIARLTNDILTSIVVNGSDARTCLQRGDLGECTTVSDTRRRQIDLRMSTRLSRIVDGGLNFTYITTEQKHTATKFSQIIFTIFARVNLISGRLR